DREGNKRNSTKVEATRVESLSRGAAPGQSGYAASPAAPPSDHGSTARPQGNSGYQQRATTGNRSGGLDIDQGLDDFPPEEEDLPF
ncbi:single-stranded DNA-binding protein, partial [Methylobacterium radiotolerans]